ncbi:MAG: hypothetical protein L0H38_01425 [bacterium]|nr:hypothetical protein [bacterium]
MEPELPTPKFTPENAPQPNQENLAEFTPQNTPELGGFEQYEQKSENQARTMESGPQQPAMAPTQPQVLNTQSPAAPQLQASDTPLVANDDDLIEKEWVDKAKKILASTRDDPYRRERDVVMLQQEYLKKRYGRALDGSD